MRRTVRFGAHTNSHYRELHNAGSKPTTDRRNKWSMYPARRTRRYSSWHPTDSKPQYNLAERTTICRKVYSVLSTVFLSCLSCCLLLV